MDCFAAYVYLPAASKLFKVMGLLGHKGQKWEDMTSKFFNKTRFVPTCECNFEVEILLVEAVEADTYI